MKRLDYFKFRGDEETYCTIGNTAISNQSVAGDKRAVRITAADHGFQSDSLVYVLGTTNYDGLRKIDAVATNTVDILVDSYTAETPGGTETLRTAISYPVPWELHGVEFHLSAAGATAENMEINKDANKGASWDVNYVTQAMNGFADVVWYPEDGPIYLDAKDVVDLTYSNTDNRTWSATFIARRRD